MAKYAVIIATHQRPLLLARAIQSVKAQTCRDVAVIVVSDDGTHATRDAAALHLSDGDTYLERGGEPGPALSRTMGLGAANADHVIFLDDDDEFSGHYLTEVDHYNKTARAGSVLFCNFHVLNDGEDRAAVAVNPPIPVTIGDRDPHDVHVLNFIPNSCLIYPIDAVKTKTFDETLILNEDWAFLLDTVRDTPLLHVPVFGPIIHKTDRRKGDRRGARNDHLLPETLKAIYKKYPAPTQALRLARQAFFTSAGISLPITEF